VAKKTICELSVDIENLQSPIVVVAMRQWSTTTRNALRFAMEMSGDVIAVHINADNQDEEHLRRKWLTCVEDPLKLKGQPAPRLICVESPYRRFFHPLFAMLKQVEAEYPGRTIAVVIPELVGGRWYDYFLHNRLTTALKAALLLNGDQRVAVVNVPWYLDRRA
jgi:hypothetical protein